MLFRSLVQEKLGAFGEYDALIGSLLDDRDPDPAAWEKLRADAEAPRVLDAAIAALGDGGFTAEDVETALRGVCESLGLKPKQAFAPIRIAIAGSTVSAGLFESIALLGRDEALRRLQRARAAV